jgi:hypothetical protein
MRFHRRAGALYCPGRHGERYLYVPLGPTAGAAIRILLTETLRISFGTAAVG